MAATEQQVLDVLKTVQDPDLHRDIVSLGFIKGLSIAGETVTFRLELTTPACPVKDRLKAECEQKILALPGVKKVEIELTAQVRATVNTTNESLKHIKHIIAVASGKGGVGKSTVACNLALALRSAGATVGLLDADIYGPSQPMMLGIAERPMVVANKVVPVWSQGMKVISMGMLIGDDAPIIWRGPMVSGIIQQFLGQVEWGALDYLVIDLPPGTGDAQLTLTQQAPLSGAVIVSTPQDVALLDARKGLRMFQQVNVPVLGIVENMSYFICDQCEKRHTIFRQGGGKRVAEELKLPLLGEIPLDSRVAEGGDAGKPIIVSHPDSPVAKAYRELAGKVAAALSVLSAAKGTALPAFQMEWKK